MKKIIVSLDEVHWNIIDKKMSEIGDSASSKIRNIVVSYLSEHGYLDKKERQK